LITCKLQLSFLPLSTQIDTSNSHHIINATLLLLYWPIVLQLSITWDIHCM